MTSTDDPALRRLDIPDAVAASLAQCIGCHDQCMFASADVVNSGRQDLVLSRLASAVRDVAGGVLPLDAHLRDALFMPLDSGAQQHHCIVLDGTQDPRDWLRWARGRLAEHDASGVRALHAARSIPADDPAGDPVDVVVVRDQVTGSLDPGGATALAALLGQGGRRVGIVTLPSSGWIEHSYGLADEAKAAAENCVAALAAYRGTPLVTDDPAVALASRTLWQAGGRPDVVQHVGETAPDEAAERTPVGTVVVDDVGLLARDLGVVEPIRAMLRRAGYAVVEAPSFGAGARDDGPLFAYPDDELRARIGQARYAELVGTGADLVVIVAPWSRRNLPSDGPVPVRSLAEVLLGASAADGSGSGGVR